jgi:hypothetical protein
MLARGGFGAYAPVNHNASIALDLLSSSTLSTLGNATSQSAATPQAVRRSLPLTLALFSPIPLLMGTRMFLVGMLVRHGSPQVIARASVAEVAVTSLSALALQASGLTDARPVLVAPISAVLGAAVSFAMVAVAALRIHRSSEQNGGRGGIRVLDDGSGGENGGRGGGAGREIDSGGAPPGSRRPSWFRRLVDSRRRRRGRRGRAQRDPDGDEELAPILQQQQQPRYADIAANADDQGPRTGGDLGLSAADDDDDGHDDTPHPDGSDTAIEIGPGAPSSESKEFDQGGGIQAGVGIDDLDAGDLAIGVEFKDPDAGVGVGDLDASVGSIEDLDGSAGPAIGDLDSSVDVEDGADGSGARGTGTGTGLAQVAKFFFPLALTMAVQGVSRPIVNLSVGKRPDGPTAIAALAIVFAASNVLYGWLNMMRSLRAAFRDDPETKRASCVWGVIS